MNTDAGEFDLSAIRFSYDSEERFTRGDRVGPRK
jgi:hypothetical protein